ncbi:MAG: sulfite exporter TauE/SafE family protein [Actinomycetota bacterium]
MPSPAILVAIGCTTGFLAGLLGAGGGFATVVLLLAAGAGAHEAVGTSLIFTVVVGAWGTAVHLRRGTASPWLAVALGLPSAATALVGAQAAEALSDRALVLWFAALTLIVAVAFLARPTQDPESAVVDAVADPRPGSLRLEMRPTTRLVVGAMGGGAVIGLLKGLFGVGGGFLLVPFMVLVLAVPEHLAVGSSLFAILIGSIAGGIRHASYGNVDWEMLWPLLPGGVAGSWIGAVMVRRVSAQTIRRAFVALMLASAAFLIAKGL